MLDVAPRSLLVYVIVRDSSAVSKRCPREWKWSEQAGEPGYQAVSSSGFRVSSFVCSCEQLDVSFIPSLTRIAFPTEVEA